MFHFILFYFIWLCLITLLKSLAKDSAQSPFQTIKRQGRLLLNLQKTEYSSLLLFVKLKETISNKTKHPPIGPSASNQGEHKTNISICNLFLSNKHIAKKTVVGGTPVKHDIRKILSALKMLYFLPALFLAQSFTSCATLNAAKEISASLASK